MGRAPVAQIRLPASLQPDPVRVARYLNYYREGAQRLYGYSASSDQIGWSAPVYLADTDEQARAEADPHIETLFNRLLRLPFQMIFPPGYLSTKSLKNMLSHKRSVSGPGAHRRYPDRAGHHPVRQPGHGAQAARRRPPVARLPDLPVMLQFATLPRELTEKNIRLFAREVMPVLQGLTDKEYAGMAVQAAE